MPSISTPTDSTTWSLQEVLDAIDRAEGSEERVQVAADHFQRLGFDRVVVSLRDASLNPTVLGVAGAPDAPSGASAPSELALKPLPGAVWRRRLPHLERFRVGGLFFLDGTDDWVAREFFGADPSPDAPDRQWLPTDLIVGVLRGPQQDVLGFVKLAGVRDGRRPDADRLRDIETIVRHLAARVAYDALGVLAQQRHERLQLLQEAGTSLTRSLDEQEIVRELVRQVQRAVRCDGVVVLVPDLDNDILSTTLRMVRNVERPRGPVRLGEGLVAEVARTGRPVRVGDRDADRARERAGLAPPLTMYDIVGESGTATSVVAVPMRVGIRLMAVLAVHSTNADMYSAEDEEVLATMAAQAATALANARRYAESERERRTTEALADVARAVGESLRLGEVLRLILRHTVSLLGVEGACVALRTGDYLHIVAAAGTADVLSGVHLPLNTSLLGRCVQGNELVVLNELSHEAPIARTVQQLARIQRIVMAPLGTGRGTIGAIAVMNRERPFDQDDAKVLQRLADQVAVAIDNARLFEEVEKATREWKVAFDTTASGIVVLEESLTVSRCNARAAELCGMSIPGLLGQRFRDVLLGAADSPDASMIDACIARALRDGVPVRETVKDLVHSRLLSLLVSAHPDGGCVITFDDVTEATRLAELHRNVLETVSDAIIITGLNGRITFANPAAKALFQREHITDARTNELIPQDWLAAVLASEASVRRGARVRYECEVLRADGTRRNVQVSSTPLVELGVIRGTVACLRDITEQRADALARERSEVLYSRLVESASDAIFTVDLQGHFISVNQGFLNESGLRREQVLGLHFGVLVDQVDRAQAMDAMRATLAGERLRLHIRCIGYNGPRMAMVTTAPIHASGQVVGALGIVRDVTNDEIQREAQLQQARLAAVGQSLGRVANELNNPLASLLAVAELHVASPTLVEDDRRAMEQMVEEARRASRIVNQLLDTTGEAPQVGGIRSAVDLNTVLRRALDLFRHSLKAQAVRVSTTFQRELPDVHGDPLQLQQVISNLLTNAEQALSEFSGDRELLLETRTEGDAVVLRLRDNGPGILPQHLPRVIEPMFTTRSARGQRGLGLTIAHAIVRDHGGQLDIQSRHGEGATATVRLPVAGAPALADRRLTPRSNAAVHAIMNTRLSSESVASETPPAPMSAPAPSTPRTELRAVSRVLLLEDEATLRSAIGRFLRTRGYQVDMTENGQMALDALSENTYDLILLDLRMKGITGEDVYETMIDAYPEQAARVVFMTGDMHSDHAARFIRQTGRPVLAKPFTLVELEKRIKQILGEPE
ncbi:PAS domain S-box protein [Gemmatimonas aurantiaca]|uniref:PAS domain S-box protein n=1 Tax=Gemmatimonas aurantiaca TaxID=173480 RepID=UPI00301E10FF